MKIVKLTILALAVLVLAVDLSSCSIPGTSGHGRYKTELLSSLSGIENDINTKGEISDTSLGKLENVLSKWEEEFGKKGSYIRAKEILELARKSNAGEDTFNNNQSIKVTAESVRSYMQTETD